MKVLIVDDDCNNLRMLVKLFAGNGHTVFGAPHGVAAIKQIERANDDNIPYEIVVTDYQMPLANGHRVAMKCILNKIPCVVMSGDHSLEDIFKGLPVEFLRKPFTVEELNLKISLAKGHILKQ